MPYEIIKHATPVNERVSADQDHMGKIGVVVESTACPSSIGDWVVGLYQKGFQVIDQRHTHTAKDTIIELLVADESITITAK